MDNRQVAHIFQQVADLLDIKGENFRRVLAYRNAAETIRGLGRDLADIRADGELIALPGIGKTLAEKIEEMLDTGRLAFLERLAADVPLSLLDLLAVEGVGPKKAWLFYDSLGIMTLDALRDAAEHGRLAALPGMGARSQERILDGIRLLARTQTDRVPLGTAWPVAWAILDRLRVLPGVRRHAVGGSLRRMRETIGDIDLLIAADEAEPIMERFVALPEATHVVGRGPTKSRITTAEGLGVDLRVVPEARWGTLLSYFTGSKAHNVRLREMAQQRGLSLNEYAFSREDGSEILCATEEEVYAVLDLPFVPPEMREDRGEIEAARRGELPALLSEAEVVADLHMHTTWSDGRRSIMEMAEAARASGLETIVISDHSVSLGIANGLSVERLRAQAADVAAANEALGPPFRVLHGTEMEIRADGTLDYPDDVLAKLDFVIAALHVSLRQSREQVTGRVLNAVRNPHVDMLAHPTGRLLPDRPGADLDVEAVLREAAEHGTIVEINANPRRLDLQDNHVRRALDLGVLLAVNTDAHHEEDFDYRRFGVATARRGWATADHVVNAWPRSRLLAHLERTR